MKTAIQELLKELETFKGMCSTDGEKFIINLAIANTKGKIKKEKQQIEEAFTISRTSDGCGWNKEDAIQSAIGYYESTFNSKVV